MSNRALAAIDLGTNTARLLIGRVEPEGIARQLVMRRITRLGGGFCRERGISAEAWERTLAAMHDFAAAIRSNGVKHVKAVATSAVRDATNGADFCREVRESTGIVLETISGELEGKLTLRGVLSGLDEQPEYLLVFDVGGGSTEYTLARGDEVLFTRSLPLGVVRLTEGKVTTAAMEEKVDRELRLLLEQMRLEGLLNLASRAVLIGTAGTATTLAAISQKLIDYDYRKINNHVIPLQEIEAIFARLLPLSPDERLVRIAGLEKGREDLIVAGTILTMRTMTLFGLPSLKVSDFSLLEGVLLDLSNTVSTQ
ncbi:MAG TPA: exopolyphosphatase [Geobacteraceae bacterium]|nr:exopolyphosphatase [Geobacteraceae bacterium]